jgi:hypothetical protein
MPRDRNSVSRRRRRPHIHHIFTTSTVNFARPQMTRDEREAGVQGVTMLVSPDGDWLLPDTPEFFAALGDSKPDYDSVSFAVKNLGFIKFHMIERFVIEIELHPRVVALPALLIVQQQLQSSPVRLFRIKYFDQGWSSEISASAEQTIGRLSELCVPEFTPPTNRRFRVERQDISQLLQDENNPLRLLAQKWRASFGIFDPSVISLAVMHRLLPRLVIAGLKPHQSDPTWRFIGDGHQWLGSEYKFRGLGEKVADIPDKDYGSWVSEFYKSVAQTGTPRYDFITGSVRYEDESGRPVRPVRYERLMLPWRTSSGEVFVTGCTRKFGTDDIPALDFEERASKTLAMSS